MVYALRIRDVWWFPTIIAIVVFIISFFVIKKFSSISTKWNLFWSILISIIISTTIVFFYIGGIGSSVTTFPN